MKANEIMEEDYKLFRKSSSGQWSDWVLGGFG